MAPNKFMYTPLPEEREASDNMQPQFIDMLKWAEHSVEQFGTEDVKFEDSEDWAVILATFEITWVMLIITIAVTLIGLIYLLLRCQGYLNPTKDYTEKIYQKCIRWLLILLMLILLAAILYFLISSITSSLALNPIQDEKKKKLHVTDRRLDHVLVFNYQEFKNKTYRSANDLIDNSLRASNVNDVPETACPPANDIEGVKERIQNINKEFELLCIEVLIWTDYMRFFHRNMSTNLLQMDLGSTLLVDLDFSNFIERSLQVDALLNFHSTFSFVERFFNSYSLLYNTTTQLPDAMQNRIRNVLSPYFLEVENDLKEKGQTFRSLSTKLGQDRAEDRSEQSKGNWRSKKPLWVYVWEWICYLIVILIALILLVASLLRCFGKRYRNEAECCNQENGSILFQLAAFLICIFFLIALLPFLWNFVHGVGLYNGVCWKLGTNRQKRAIEVDATHSDTNCLNEYSIQKFVESVSIKPNFTQLIAEDLKLIEKEPELRKYSNDFKQKAKDAKNINLTNVCDDIKIDMDPAYFSKVYNKMFEYVNGPIENKQTKKLGLCNLNTFKKYIIDQIGTNTMYKSADQIAEECKKVVDFFSESYTQITTKCIDSIEKMGNYYSRDNKHNLSAIVDSLNEMYADELNGYVDMVEDALANKVGLCRRLADTTDDEMECHGYAHILNTIWSALMILLWLLLPLIPIALYLARLYGTNWPLKKCSCVNRKSREQEQSNWKGDRTNQGANTSRNLMSAQQQILKNQYRNYRVENRAQNGQPMYRRGRINKKVACSEVQQSENVSRDCYEKCSALEDRSNSVHHNVVVHETCIRLYKEEIRDAHKPSTSESVCHARKESTCKSTPPKIKTEKCFNEVEDALISSTPQDECPHTKMESSYKSTPSENVTKKFINKIEVTYRPSTSKSICDTRKDLTSKSMPPKKITKKCFSQVASGLRSIPEKARTPVCSEEHSTYMGKESMETAAHTRNSNASNIKILEKANTPEDMHREPSSSEEKCPGRYSNGEEIIPSTYEPSTSTKQTTNKLQIKIPEQVQDPKEFAKKRRECREKVIKATASLHIIQFSKK
ncbi:uncharacterized protein LOC129241960 [Anastrepha obliqua]|uniref:uncharacterized protein LOC129241960 n=1 Tax=Anastrepha obliqua TaxID=95512 RepID=UPI0024097A70|nr:uncharacterized protein LOC129241960 [Anastrepha obliqua]